MGQTETFLVQVQGQIQRNVLEVGSDTEGFLVITLTSCLGGEFSGEVFADTKHPLDRSLLPVTGSL